MSDLSELIHGHESFAAFLAKEAEKVRSVIGSAIVDNALDGAADEIETVQATVSRALHAFLDGKGLAGSAAASLVDAALHSIAGLLEGAARAAEQSK